MSAQLLLPDYSEPVDEVELAIEAMQCVSAEVYYVTPEGKCYRNMDEKQLDDFSEWADSTMSDLPPVQHYYRTYTRKRVDRDGDFTKVYHYVTDDDGYGGAGRARAACEAEHNLLGSGHYSCVIECPWDVTKVIKIGHGPDADGDYWSDGWLSWAAFSMYMHTIGDAPLLPKVHSIVFKDSCFVALIDRYECAWDERDGSEAYEGNESELDERYYAIQRAMENSWGFDHDVSEEIEAEAKALLEHPLCPSLNDTHSGNFMLNGRYLVITDPSSNDYSMRSHKEAIMRKLGLAV